MCERPPVTVFIPLEERTAIANREHADLFLSIHANSSRNKQAHGIEQNTGSRRTSGRLNLDQTIGDEGDSQLGDFIEDSEAVVAVDAVSFSLLQDQLQQVLQTLSEREAGVVRLRFGLTDGQPRTLDEIGQVYGVTRERIRQIESKTMSKLRHPSRSQVLRDYLD